MHTKRLVDAALPHLEATRGSIVAVSSVSGREVDFFKHAYGVMKAALVHYMYGLAFDLAPKGVRANAVSPGNVYFAGGVWPMIERDNPDLFDAVAGAQPDRADGDGRGGRLRGDDAGQPAGRRTSAARTSSSTARSPAACSSRRSATSPPPRGRPHRSA